ncbi:DUF3291 domain-containing protein [Phenylobacterium sp. VNQ135]|uniref:DUF3291 domain-containing protein n=1 Tax=Phenylobacterium sp. VNQ135 TaxID=3400922 RepID=UPI003C00634E
MTGYHLAQINVGRFLAPVDDPRIADFVANLDRINALADETPGFVWRLVGEGNNATDIQPRPNDPLSAINMSVWTGLDALAGFVYRTAHRDVMRRRREWFEAMETYMALWWVPVGHVPTIDEALRRLDVLDRLGPTAEAFTFRDPFPAPDATPVAPVLDKCA